MVWRLWCDKMRILSAEEVDFLKDKFRELKEEVEIKASVNDEIVENLLLDMEEISEGKIKLDLKKDVQTKIEIGVNKGYKIIFLGPPLGYEVRPFIDAIIYASKGNSNLSEAEKTLVEKISNEKEIMVFVTPSCPHCPHASHLAAQLAIEKPELIKAIVVEANSNPNLSNKFGVTAVPTIVINNKVVSVGFKGRLGFIKDVLSN